MVEITKDMLEFMEMEKQLTSARAEIERLKAEAEYLKEQCYAFNAEGTIKDVMGTKRVRGTVRDGSFHWRSESGCGFLPVRDVVGLQYITRASIDVARTAEGQPS